MQSELKRLPGLTPPLTDEFYLALGKVTAHFAVLEGQVEFLTWSLIRPGPTAGTDCAASRDGVAHGWRAQTALACAAMRALTTDPVSPAETVFLVGAGGQQDSWKPVFAAINDGHPDVTIQDADSANFYFAMQVYLHRYACQVRDKKRAGRSNIEAPLEHMEEMVSELTESSRRLKKRIAERLIEAVSVDAIPLHMSLLKELQNPRWGKMYVVTTNWDRTIERYIKTSEVVHLHGDTDESHLLFLPTEMIEEPYRDDADSHYVRANVAFAWQAIATANNLCVYGLSLSALDAALGQVVSVGFSDHREGNPLHVHIFNCADQIPSVENRMRMLSQPALRLNFNRVPVC